MAQYTDVDGRGLQSVAAIAVQDSKFDGTDVNAGATAAAGAMAPALAAVAGARNFLTAFEITGAGATAASVISATITGLLGGTITFNIAVPAGATVGITPLLVVFARPLRASADNTAITLNVPSFGAGNTNAAAAIHGFYRNS